MGGELSRGAGRSIRTSTGFDGAGCPTAIAASRAVRLVLEVSAALRGAGRGLASSALPSWVLGVAVGYKCRCLA